MSKTSRRFPFARAFSQLLRVILPAALLAISGRAVSAQDFGLSEGSRVQISVPGSNKVTGIVKSSTADSTAIFVDGNGGTRRFATKDITELRVSRGKSTMEGVKKGAIWGGGVGVILGLAFLATPQSDSYYYGASNTNSLAAQMFIGSLFWGVGLGGLIKAEHWDSVPLHTAFSASSGGVGLSVAFSPPFLH